MAPWLSLYGTRISKSTRCPSSCLLEAGAPMRPGLGLAPGGGWWPVALPFGFPRCRHSLLPAQPFLCWQGAWASPGTHWGLLARPGPECPGVLAYGAGVGFSEVHGLQGHALGCPQLHSTGSTLGVQSRVHSGTPCLRGCLDTLRYFLPVPGECII